MQANSPASKGLKLSLCIPTYNRPAQFEKTLRGIISQVSEGVQIVVRDDSENDKTEKITFRLLGGTTIDFKYFHGKKSGVDSAALFLIEQAEADYIWWFSDDDELLPGAIQFVLSSIAEKKYAAIWANYTFGDQGELAVDRASGQFTNCDEALRILGKNVGLISTQIVRRDLALDALPFGIKHSHGFSFASTAVFLHALGTPDTASLFFRGPALKCYPTPIEEIKKTTTSTGKINNGGFKVYGEYFKEVIDDLGQKFSPEAKRTLIASNFASLWRGMVVGWLGGWDTPEGKRMSMLKRYWSYPECWIALAIFCSPKAIVGSIYRIYKLFYSHRKFVLFERIKDSILK